MNPFVYVPVLLIHVVSAHTRVIPGLGVWATFVCLQWYSGGASQALAERDKTRILQDAVGGEIVQLEVVHVQEPPKEPMHGQGEAPLHNASEAHSLVGLWLRRRLISRNAYVADR